LGRRIHRQRAADDSVELSHAAEIAHQRFLVYWVRRARWLKIHGSKQKPAVSDAAPAATAAV
jgi:hypothetical protein